MREAIVAQEAAVAGSRRVRVRGRPAREAATNYSGQRSSEWAGELRRMRSYFNGKGQRERERERERGKQTNGSFIALPLGYRTKCLCLAWGGGASHQL